MKSVTHKKAVAIHEGVKVLIDAKIYNLIGALWSRHYDTMESCECNGREGLAYIRFKDDLDTVRFAMILIQAGINFRHYNVHTIKFDPVDIPRIEKEIRKRPLKNFGFDGDSGD